MSTGLTTLNAAVSTQVKWSPAAIQPTGKNYTATSNSSTLGTSYTLGTSAANNAAGGADLVMSTLYIVSASSHTDIDLTSITDIVGRTSIAFARVKWLQVRLLSASMDATNGTTAVSCYVGQAGGSGTNIWTGFTYGSSDTYTVYNGGSLAMGSANAAGVAVDGTHKLLRITNNDSGVSAAIEVSVIGGSS